MFIFFGHRLNMFLIVKEVKDTVVHSVKLANHITVTKIGLTVPPVLWCWVLLIIKERFNFTGFK